jgi:hypothetical protein
MQLAAHFRLRFRPAGRVIGYLAVAAASISPVGKTGGQQLDTARALTALREARSACEIDAGALWKRNLCGPIALVDRQTRIVIANDTVAGRRFVRFGDAYLTTLPDNQYVANTGFQWVGRTWTMIALPLPRDRFARVDLLMHEVFHREQQALGLRQVDALNNQLDMRAGRTWLRLEYRALARALESLPNAEAARHHAESALIFRALRRSLYPGSDSLEATLEIQEGLPEYTGQRLAMQLTGEGPARVAKYVRDYEATPTFVRAFAYATGPAIGILLDHFDPAWRDAVRTKRDLSGLLAQAIRFRSPAKLAAVARVRAMEYGWEQVDSTEAARDSARAPLMRDYRARFADGPTITLRQSKDSLSWSYDPTELVAFDLYSTVYPSGNFSAPWGKLTVERGGVLVQNDFSQIKVGVLLTRVTPEAREIKGDTWTLSLNPGWALRPDSAQQKNLVVQRTQP